LAERWISIRRASEILGVNPATLRQWGDSGKLRTFVTPGGHRRFSEDELILLTQNSPNLPARQPVPTPAPLTAPERFEAIARRGLTEASWFHALDEASRRKFRILGSSMLSLIESYLRSGKRERERSLVKGREIASEYGAEAARLGLTYTEATEAFLLFRAPVLEGLNRWLRDRQPSRRESDELFRRANHFMDQVLLSMAASHSLDSTARSSELSR
jgi:excisionase family DNA binding protein